MPNCCIKRLKSHECAELNIISSPRAKPTGCDGDFCGIIFDMLQYVDVNDAVEVTPQ